jgi:serine/threonine protein kinase
MPAEPACACCGAPLISDAPEGAICEDCAAAQQPLPGAESEATTQDDTHARTPHTPSSQVRTPGGSVRGQAPAMAERIGDFEVLGKLGQGGMGAVYRARQMSLDRPVALKILPSQFEEDETYVTRFRREASTAASLNHPNLVRVYASGEADGCHYIAMELVEGENLRQRLKRLGPMPPLEVLTIGLQVARGLQCGWQTAQLIHRDIKPSNLYITEAGEVKVGDLGLAKSLLANTTGVTHTGAAIGTPHYISPEQARGEKSLDLRADLYSLGCTLYELLTGKTPYQGTDALSIINMHITGPPPAIMKVMPECPVPLGRIVNKMVRKARHERHQTYEELIAAMEWPSSKSRIRLKGASHPSSRLGRKSAPPSRSFALRAGLPPSARPKRRAPILRGARRSGPVWQRGPPCSPAWFSFGQTRRRKPPRKLISARATQQRPANPRQRSQSSFGIRRKS